MSVADLKQYGVKIAQDPAVRAKAKQIGMNDLDSQIKYASTLGLTFTAADIQALAREAAAGKQELSEEQLEQIAGGAFTLSAATALGLASLVLGAASFSVQVGSEASRNW